MSFACKHLLVEENAGVLSVTLNRPEVRNAFNEELIAELHRFSTWVNQEKGIRLVFLKGSGKVFCAGGDLNWMKSSLDWDKPTNYADSQKLSDMFTALNHLEKPLIGLIQGGAYGGGVGLVSVCDHVVCTEDTIFSLSEVRLGLIPACIGPFVVEKIGYGQARSLFISGERINAMRAHAIGLVHELVKKPEDFAEVMVRLSKTFLTCGPEAVKTAKVFLRELKGLPLPKANELAAKTLADLRVGKEAQEGLRAFLEKRQPKW